MYRSKYYSSNAFNNTSFVYRNLVIFNSHLMAITSHQVYFSIISVGELFIGWIIFLSFSQFSEVKSWLIQNNIFYIASTYLLFLLGYTYFSSLDFQNKIGTYFIFSLKYLKIYLLISQIFISSNIFLLTPQILLSI